MVNNNKKKLSYDMMMWHYDSVYDSVQLYESYEIKLKRNYVFMKLMDKRRIKFKYHDIKFILSVLCNF